MSHSFVVITPYYGKADFDHLGCMRAVEQMGVPMLPLRNCPYLDIARSYLATEALRQCPDVEVLFWIDHDMIFNAKDIPKMVDTLMASEYGMTGAAYSMRKPGLMLGVQPLTATEVTFYKPGLVDGKYVSMGFTAIKRTVFERMAESLPLLYTPCVKANIYPFFERFIEPIEPHGTDGQLSGNTKVVGNYHPDDIGFCHRANQFGFSIGIDTEPRVFHRGEYDYALEDAGLTIPNCETLTIKF